jgi:LemA protein
MGKYLIGCGLLLVVGIILIVVIGGAMWADNYNKLVGGRQGVDAAWAEVENQYQRRADLIPNLVQTVSGLGNALSRLLVVSERYPDLKANQNFIDLQAQLEGTENRITTARGNFNQAAQSYNTTVQSFPTNFIAGMSGFTVKPYFKAKEGTDTPPPVHFDFNSNPTNTAPAPAPAPAH